MEDKKENKRKRRAASSCILGGEGVTKSNQQDLKAAEFVYLKASDMEAIFLTKLPTTIIYIELYRELWTDNSDKIQLIFEY